VPVFFNDHQSAMLQAAHPGLQVQGCIVADHIELLHAEELNQVAHASQFRRDQYSTGRYLAHQCMKKLGVTATALTSTARGYPTWPANTVGSISHTSSLAVAAAGSSNAYAGVGIDIESAGRIRQTMARRLLTAGELTRLRGFDPTIYFGAKEAVFKLLFPLVHEYIGFTEIELELCLAAGSFSVGYRGGNEGLRFLDDIRGSVLQIGKNWLCCVTLPRNIGTHGKQATSEAALSY
jgi:4'-phosphopantetheinyl transferase EntD